MDNIYNQTIEIGKFQSNMSLLYSIMVGIVICAVVIFVYKYFKSQNDNFIDTAAKILKSECKYYMTEKDGGKYSCDLQIEYIIDGKSYINNIISNNTIQYKIGSNIDISYDKNDPNVMKLVTLFDKIIYLIPFFIIGTVLLSCGQAYYKYYMAHNFGVYSSIFGASSAFGSGFKQPF